jgi:Rieske Fe-S protein
MNRDMQSCAGCTTRRVVLAGAGAAAATLVTGCQVYGRSSNKDAPAPAGTGTTPPAATNDGSSGGSAQTVAQVADVPVGGGKVIGDKGIVVTQPQQGTFKAFSAVCTHAGCTVAGVSGGTINCGCHGSKFAIADGSVKGGPAPKPLAAVAINVKGGAITLA